MKVKELFLKYSRILVSESSVILVLFIIACVYRPVRGNIQDFNETYFPEIIT